MTMSQFRLRLTSPMGSDELPLADFLVAELDRQYGVGRTLGKRWVEAVSIIPMLDGLDEVPTAKRGLCLDRINEYRRSHTSVKFVVACRQAEYAELSADVDAHSAAVVQKLKRADAETYIAKHDAFRGLRLALNAAPELWEVMDIPLILWVAAFAFENLDEEDLARNPVVGLPEKMRAMLWDRYVDRMLQRGDLKPGRRGPSFAFDDTKR